MRKTLLLGWCNEQMMVEGALPEHKRRTNPITSSATTASRPLVGCGQKRRTWESFGGRGRAIGGNGSASKGYYY